MKKQFYFTATQIDQVATLLHDFDHVLTDWTIDIDSVSITAGTQTTEISFTHGKGYIQDEAFIHDITTSTPAAEIMQIIEICLINKLKHKGA